MANYFVINRPSNLIIDVTTTSYTPEDTNLKKFVLANDKALTIYYKWIKANPDVMMDIGDLASRAKLVKDIIFDGKTGKSSPKRFRYRDEVQPAIEDDRASLIAEWLRFNPTADEYNLDERFCTGVVAARAYLSRYRP